MTFRHLTFIAWWLLALSSLGHAQSLVTITETGARNARLNLVMLSEGYTSAELSANKFKNDATTISNALLNTEPFKSYRPFFNVYGIAVASAQSGADKGSAGGFRNTYFNAYYYDPPLERLLVIDSTGYSRATSLLNTFVPEHDIVLVIVNDSMYGGSGGAYAVTSTNSSAAEIAIHEIGHSFAGLGDEYDYAGSTPQETPNTTQETRRSFIKWNHWINTSTPITTPETSTYDNGVVGLFEGAAYSTTGWYRPTLDSKMQTLGEPFYAVNEEAIVLSIYQRVSPMTSSTPTSTTVTVNQPNQTLIFTVDGPSTASTAPAIKVEWKLDGTIISGQTGRTLSRLSNTIGDGTHTLVATVSDPTTKVRKDTTNLLKASRSWTLNVTNQGPVAPSALAATHQPNGSITLSWTDNSSDEAGFVIERALGTSTTYTEITRVAINATTYTDTTTTPGTSTKYRVRGINAADSSVFGPASNTVTVTPLIIPNITQDPLPAFVPLGTTASFTVQATGTLLKYQWRRNTVNINGATSATYKITSAQAAHVGSYDCVVSNALASATSAAASLTLDSAPIFTLQPLNKTVRITQPVTFSAQAVGAPGIQYQWRKNSQDLAGETAATLTIAMPTMLDAGRYDCIATNTDGSTPSKVAMLSVNGAPSFTVHPLAATVNRGETAVFVVEAIGTAPMSYQWFHNGLPLSGAKSNRCTVSNVKDSSLGVYHCVVSNSYGTDLSAGVSLAFANTSPPVSDYKAAGAEPGSAKWLWAQRLGSAGGYDSVMALGDANGMVIAGGQSEGADTKFGSISLNAPSNWVAAFDPRDGKAFWAVSTGHGLGTRCLVDAGRGKVFASGAGNGAYTLHDTFSAGTDWTHYYGSSSDPISGIATDGNGSVYLCRADTTSLKSNVAKFNPLGGLTWEREISVNGSGSVTVTSMVRSSSGSIVVCGKAQAGSTTTLTLSNAIGQPALSLTQSTPSLSTGFIAAYTASGTPIWINMYGLEITQVSAYFSGLWTTGRAVVDGNIVSVADNVDKSNGSRTQPSINLGTATAISIAAYPNYDFAVLCHVQSTTQNLRTYTSPKPGYVVARFDRDGVMHWVLPVWGELSLASNEAPSALGKVMINGTGIAFVGLTLGTSTNTTSTQFAGLTPMDMTGRIEDGFIARIAEVPHLQPLADQMIALGDSLDMVLVSSAELNARYQWYKNGKAVSGQTTSTYHVDTPTFADAGTYYCKVTANGVTVTSSTAVVNVVDAASHTYKAPLGKPLDLPVIASGPGLRYRWFKDTELIFDADGYASSLTSKLRILSMSPAFARTDYTCEVSGPGGSMMVNFITADVLYPPAFTAPVVPASVVSGAFDLQLSASDAASYKVSTLPSGLVYDPKTGRITGKPTTPGTKLITVTATNAAGTSNPALAFTIIVNDIAAYAKGSFQALIERQPWNANLGGYLSFTLSASGTPTGTLKYAGASYTLNSRVNADTGSLGWAFYQRIARTGKPALLVNLTSPPAQDSALTGTIELEDATPETATVSGRQTVWSATRPATLYAGTFNATMALPALLVGDPGVPQGPNTLKTVITASTGAVAWSGKLGDNTSFSGSTKLWPFGNVPTWLALYSNYGSLLGSPLISSPNQTGTLEWTRNPKTGQPSWTTFPLTVTGTQAP